MLGLIIALIIAGINYLFLGNSGYVIYQNATRFLYPWYIWTSVAYGVFYVVIAVILLLGLPIMGAEKGRLPGVIAGFIGASALSLLILILAAVSRGCLIAGSLLLTQALVFPVKGEPVWDLVKLIFGGLLILAGIITGHNLSDNRQKND